MFDLTLKGRVFLQSDTHMAHQHPIQLQLSLLIQLAQLKRVVYFWIYKSKSTLQDLKT